MLTFGNLRKPLHLVVLAIVLVIVVVVFGSNILTKNNNYNPDNKSSCRLAGNSCEVVLPQGQMRVLMERLPAIEEQIPVTITAPENVSISSVYIEGVNMFMGKVPVILERRDNTWTGWYMLGACSEPEMQWRMVIETENRPEPVSVYFKTQM